MRIQLLAWLLYSPREYLNAWRPVIKPTSGTYNIIWSLCLSSPPRDTTSYPSNRDCLSSVSLGKDDSCVYNIYSVFNSFIAVYQKNYWADVKLAQLKLGILKLIYIYKLHTHIFVNICIKCINMCIYININIRFCKHTNIHEENVSPSA